MTDASHTPGFRLTGWHVLAAVVTFFGVVIAVDVTFLLAAYRSFPGQVSVTPYEDGLAYNKHMAQQRAQDALGWRAAVAIDTQGVMVEVFDRQGAPLAGLKLAGLLSRPATEAGRLTLAFTEIAPGRYAARVKPGSGAWDLAVTAQGEGAKRLEAERRLSWP